MNQTPLKFLAAEPGTLASDALIETNLRSNGRVWVGIVEPTGVTGDGSIAVLSFETLEGGASESSLVLEDISSYRASTYLDSLQQPTPGHFGLDQGSLAPPSLVFPLAVISRGTPGNTEQQQKPRA